MPKRRTESGITKRVISSNSISFLNYRKVLRDVADYNEAMPDIRKIKMETNFLTVKTQLTKSLRFAGLNPKEHLVALVSALLIWPDDLKYRAIASDSTHHDFESEEQIKKRHQDLETAADVLGEFAERLVESNPKLKPSLFLLLGELESELKEYERKFRDIKKNIHSKRAISSRDKSIFHMYKILSQGLGPKDQDTPIYAEIFYILQKTYGIEETKKSTGYERMRSAASNYEKKLKTKIK